MNRQRARIVIHGAVQGVGFRPFVYRLANELGLEGWVSNSAGGVCIEVEGAQDSLSQFLLRLEQERPTQAVLKSVESSFLDPVDYDGFKIAESDPTGEKTALILPDIATCADCLDEILDPANRRFRYPFTNCTNCGPRFSIIEALPYDRANTSMKAFAMCEECRREYHDPTNRRFHAQPNACPKCGPHLQFLDEKGTACHPDEDALVRAAAAVRTGHILALKGIGGFQLLVDARNEAAVNRLRQRKLREAKPFAVMVASLECARQVCEISEEEKRLLSAPASPIVLLSALPSFRTIISSSVAPGNPNLGLMLPYTPLHHLLMRELAFPVVATSGNLSDEPICIDEDEAVNRLAGIADGFLVHNRPIVRHVDDSIVRIMCGRQAVLRRARGYAPLPITFRSGGSATVLSLGAHLKNSIALRIRDNVFVSQHIGDLETEQAFAAFRRSAADLPRLYDAKIDFVACDLHPEYLSTKFAAELEPPKVAIQHHWAHVAGCMAENEVSAPALGVSWDGTGFGLDATIWGGEFLLAHEDGSFERVAHFRTFCLPGGDRAAKEPRRSGLGVLYEIFGDHLWSQSELLSAFSTADVSILRTMLGERINAPVTSSAGRLFDAVASLVGLRQQSSFEGQAAMELEFAGDLLVREAYPYLLSGSHPAIIDWEPAIKSLLNDLRLGVSCNVISAKFHNMLAKAIAAVAERVGQAKVVLTGGCFQNRLLLERAVEALKEAGFRPIWHQRIPPNDGGIALGQVVAATWRTNQTP